MRTSVVREAQSGFGKRFDKAPHETVQRNGMYHEPPARQLVGYGLDLAVVHFAEHAVDQELDGFAADVQSVDMPAKSVGHLPDCGIVVPVRPRNPR